MNQGPPQRKTKGQNLADTSQGEDRDDKQAKIWELSYRTRKAVRGREISPARNRRKEKDLTKNRGGRKTP